VRRINRANVANWRATESSESALEIDVGWSQIDDIDPLVRGRSTNERVLATEATHQKPMGNPAVRRGPSTLVDPGPTAYPRYELLNRVIEDKDLEGDNDRERCWRKDGAKPPKTESLHLVMVTTRINNFEMVPIS